MPLLFQAYGFSGSSSRAALYACIAAPRAPSRICTAERAALLPREITLDLRRGPGAMLGSRTRIIILFKRIDRNTKDGDIVAVRALVLAEGAFGSAGGKTANGLVRYSRRFQIVGVIDSTKAGGGGGGGVGGGAEGRPGRA